MNGRREIENVNRATGRGGAYLFSSIRLHNQRQRVLMAAQECTKMAGDRKSVV